MQNIELKTKILIRQYLHKLLNSWNHLSRIKISSLLSNVREAFK